LLQQLGIVVREIVDELDEQIEQIERIDARLLDALLGMAGTEHQASTAPYTHTVYTR
jgi:hypothetical protein